MPITDTDCLVITSDEHVNSRLGLCHPEGMVLEEGNPIGPSEMQLRVWAYWEDFWNNWVPAATDGAPYVWINNGDAMDGTGEKHKNVDVMSANRQDQHEHVVKIFEPIGKLPQCKAVVWIKGTEAHGDRSGQCEEALARELAKSGVPIVRTSVGRYSHWDVYKRLGSKRGKGGCLVHCLHHIGTTGSQHYETTGLQKELIEGYVEAARWRDEPMGGIVRSHRHRALQIRLPAQVSNLPFSQEAVAVITPGWQLKTPLVYRIAGARISQPQFGGAVIRIHKGVLYATGYTKRLERPPEI